MRRFHMCAMVALLLGLLAVLATTFPADGVAMQTAATPVLVVPAATQAETTTFAIATAPETVTFASPADHVAVHWKGQPDARVTLAFSSDGRSFTNPVDAGRDDAGEERNDGTTYSAVHPTGGALAVRVTADVPLAEVTVVAIPAGGGASGGVGGGVIGRLFAAGDIDPLAWVDVGQPTVISRAGWGANTAYLSWAPRFYPATKVIVHHTSDNIVLNESPEYYAKLVRAIYYYHAITQDWGDIAYSFIIDPLGNVYEGRYSDDDPLSPPGEDVFGNGVVGGHCANYNTATVGIAVLGTYNKQDITVASRASLEWLLAWVVTRHGIDPLGADPYFNPYNSGSTIQTWNIAGHLDYRPTDCPGATFHKALPIIRQTVFDITGPVTAPVPPPTYLVLQKSTSAPVVGQQVTLTATLTEERSRTPLPGQVVSFAIGGVATGAGALLGTAITDELGVATLQMTCITAQLQWVSARFDPGASPGAAQGGGLGASPGAEPLAQTLYRGATTSTELNVALSGLTAVAGMTEVRLTWTPDAAAGGYNIYRDGKKVNSAPVLTAEYLDAGLTNPAASFYQVTAIVNGRESAKSPSVTPDAASPGGTPGGTPGGGSGGAPVDDQGGAHLFPDVLPTHPYYAAVEDLARAGVINGAPGGVFLPDGSVTRQQFAKMIVLGGGYPVSEADACAFKDVTKGGPATLYPDNYVAVCAARGITRGKTATTFDPYGTITRAQVLTMVVRAAADLDLTAVQKPPAGWKGVLPTKDPNHGQNIARAEYSGLLAGIDLAAFSVSGAATRGEIAQIIWNLRAK